MTRASSLGLTQLGRRVRFEVQRRYPKNRALVPRGVQALNLRQVYGEAVSPYTTREAVAVGRDQAEERLIELAASGAISMAKAERLVGTIGFLNRAGRGIYADSSGRRRLAELRALGITPEAVAPVERTVPVGRLLRESLESWSGGR